MHKIVLFALLFTAVFRAGASEATVFIGTYTRGAGKGIYTARLDLDSGRLSAPLLAAESSNPSFLALHPNGRFLYAANEIQTFNGEKAGAVSAFAVNAKTGQLTFLNQQSSRGGGPCHLAVDRTGRNVLVANYGGGSVAVLPIRADGALQPASSFHQHTGASVNERRQKEPHAHSINLAPDNRHAFAPDLGIDKVMAYRFDATKGALIPGEPPFAAVKPGSGPRHFAFSPDARHAYGINELLSTITVFGYDQTRGQLAEAQTISTLPADFSGNNSTAHIEVHPGGKFVYGSNRGHDSVAVFARDPQTGRLTLVEHEPTGGKVPRNFGIAPGGKFLLAANQQSDSVAVFAIDARTGTLTATGQSIRVGAPVCLKFLVAN